MILSKKYKQVLKSNFLPICISACILLISLIPYFSSKKYEKVVLSAYSDGVMGGADIIFYKNGTMEYCNMSLFYKECYSGNYKIERDTFIVKYSDKLPELASPKFVKTGKKLLFLSSENSIEYEFYLDQKYVKYK